MAIILVANVSIAETFFVTEVSGVAQCSAPASAAHAVPKISARESGAQVISAPFHHPVQGLLMFSMPHIPKQLIEQSIVLPAALLAPDAPASGRLPGGRVRYSFDFYRHRVRLSYKVDGEQLDYEIDVDRTACNYGGERRWWICWCCERRRRALYLPLGKALFGCRECFTLTYATQRLQPIQRLARRLQAQRARCPTVRTKGMHSRTWFRRQLGLYATEREFWLAAARRVGSRPGVISTAC